MPQKGKSPMLKIEQTLTAFDVRSQLDALIAWLNALNAEDEAFIDASTVHKIDTAGCQFIDMAITAGQKKCKHVRIELSPTLVEGLRTLGVDHDPQ